MRALVHVLVLSRLSLVAPSVLPVRVACACHRRVVRDVQLALANALRYFPEHTHEVLAPEFLQELKVQLSTSAWRAWSAFCA